MTASPLLPGEPLTYWQVGPTVERRYDIADAPMNGAMDPFFFLTKEKNFIPHEYPCRTAFAAAHRGRRPEVAGSFAAARNWLPFGAPRLDLSGFWFRPTQLATWAETALVTEAAGLTRLRLTTCGGAVLYVNGAEAGWMAPYSRNLEATAEFEVPLPAGENRIAVFFDDLAERDARYYIQLDWLSGPAARAALPFAAPEATVRALEATLEAMHFDRPAYDGGPVAVTLPVPLPMPAEARIGVAGDFMSHDPKALVRQLPAGAGALPLGSAEDFPADFRHFHVELRAGGFTAARTLGVEIVHAARQGTPSPRLGDRIEEALHTVALHGEADIVTGLARLACGYTGAETEAMIARVLPMIDDCWDCADFELVPLIWARTRFAERLSPELRAQIDAVMLGYRYWMDEPGNDVQWYFSENHALLFHTAAYLAGHHLQGSTFRRSGRSGTEQSATGRARVRAWLDHFEAWEMAEFNSAPYFPIDLKGLCTLQALAPDADIRERAGRGILRLLTIVANSAHQGVLTAAQGRSYEHTLRAGLSLELSGIGRLVWGRGSFGARFHALPQLALCLRDHGLVLPDGLAPRAVRRGGGQEWCFRQGEAPDGAGGFAALYHWKTEAAAMGSAARYRWFDWGYQETLIHARIGAEPQAQVWINHPGELIHSGYGRPSYWGGSASVPRVQQYKGLALVLFRGQPAQPGFTHAWFPQAAFDAVLIDGATAAAAQGAGRLMLAASGPLDPVSTGPTTGCELRLAGREGLWLVRIGADGGPLAGFAARHAGLSRPEIDADRIVVQDAEYGQVIFHADGTVEAEGRRLDPVDWTVPGRLEEID